jgi:hypothetical protein
MNEEKVINGLTVIVMGAIIAVVVGVFVGAAWRFIIRPYLRGWC